MAHTRIPGRIQDVGGPSHVGPEQVGQVMVGLDLPRQMNHGVGAGERALKFGSAGLADVRFMPSDAGIGRLRGSRAPD